jgi:MurNAc alpha-1-phosphate uridylyltransferase
VAEAYIKTAMILAAGRGERMRPLTDGCPKPLLPIRGQPMIEYHLNALHKAGVGLVVINISWLAEQIRETLGDGSRFGLQIEYSVEPEALETAGGIIQALPLLGDDFIVINGDIFTDYDFMCLTNASLSNHLVLVPNPPHNPNGDFSIEQGLLKNPFEQTYTFAGIARYRKDFFQGMDPGRRTLAPLLRMAADEGSIGAEVYHGAWQDVGTAERLKALS